MALQVYSTYFCTTDCNQLQKIGSCTDFGEIDRKLEVLLFELENKKKFRITVSIYVKTVMIKIIFLFNIANILNEKKIDYF